MYFALQSGDIFLWKVEKIINNLPSGGYVYGQLEHKDIFKETTTIRGKRPHKPNSKYIGQN